MKCLGRKKGFKRCQNQGRMFCRHHRFQPWIAIFTVCTVAACFAGLYQDLIRPVFSVSNSAEKSGTNESATQASDTSIEVSNENANAGGDITTTINVNPTQEAVLNDYLTYDGKSDIPVYEKPIYSKSSDEENILSWTPDMTKVVRIKDYTERFMKEREGRDPSIASVNWTRIKILEGDSKDLVGWVRTRFIDRL